VFQSSQTPQLLLVDDNPHDCRLLEEAVGDLGSIVRLKCFHDGKALFEYLRRPHPYEKHLILLDLNIPQMNGFDILDELRSDSQLRPIPVVIWTTSSNPQDIEKAYRLGANSYLSKPDQYSSLKETLQILARYWSSFSKLPGLGS
jgi:CheY-like chemotaxis protein